MTIFKSYCFLACLWQKALILPIPSSRDGGSVAKVIRSQFFIPTAKPATKPTNYSTSLQSVSKVYHILHTIYSFFSYSQFVNPTSKTQILCFLPAKIITDSSLDSFIQKSISSSMSSSRDTFSFTCSGTIIENFFNSIF